MRSILGEHFGEDPGPEPRQWVVHLVAAVDEDVLLTTVAVEVTVQNDVIALRYPREGSIITFLMQLDQQEHTTVAMTQHKQAVLRIFMYKKMFL